MIRVKVTIPGAADNLSLEEYTGTADSSVDDVRFYVNAAVEEPDLWLVFDDGVSGDSAIIDPTGKMYYAGRLVYDPANGQGKVF